MDFRFSSADGQLIIGKRVDGTELLIEPGQDGWEAAVASSPATYVAPALPDPLISERAAMTVSRFQAMAALLNAGLRPALRWLGSCGETPWPRPMPVVQVGQHRQVRC